jgi:hypothetical protein
MEFAFKRLAADDSSDRSPNGKEDLDNARSARS